MAEESKVKQYLAYWFQLGKPVWIRNGQEYLLPNQVIQGHRYSDEFETCWQRITAADAGDCYLDGTVQTIAQLLSPAWEISGCSRCAMPVPVLTRGFSDSPCPCFDLPTWPNDELPPPRSPISTVNQLRLICDRLEQSIPHNPEETE